MLYYTYYETSNLWIQYFKYFDALRLNISLLLQSGLMLIANEALVQNRSFMVHAIIYTTSSHNYNPINVFRIPYSMT